MRKIILLTITFFTVIGASAQDFSNKGKDFWVGYGYHQQMTNAAVPGGSQDMVLYFATEQVTNITISLPATGYTQTITTAAGNNVVTSATIPKTGANDARLTAEGLSNKGIHITSDKPMVAYAHVYNQSVSGATILFPTATLGREYYSVNYKNWSNSQNSNCWFYVVAADTGTTTLEITPVGNTTGGWISGSTYTVTLTQGQIYNVMGSLIASPTNCNPVCTAYDLTGSKIKSVNTGSGCKKIAVFSGSGRISITCNNNSSSSDNYMVQAMPRTAWGKKYLTVPANGNQANNIYRVCVTNPATIVKINGVVTTLPLLNGFYYEIGSTNQPQKIEADSAIMVAQYFTSQNACGNGATGDPEVIYLSAVEQNINKVLWNATPNFLITAHNFNVVLPNTGTAVSSFRLDGATVTGFVAHPQDPNYVYLKRNVTAGFHVIQSDSGFNAIAYGFGGAESYGYNAGTNIKDLYQQIGVQTTYGIETTPSVCTNSPFKFKVSLPYIPDSMRWNFNGAVGMSPNNNTVYINNTGNVAEDSTTVVNGRTIHWYSIPIQYTFSIVGVYPITITAFVPNNDCGSVQDIDFDLGVSDPPPASFNAPASGCFLEPVVATETTPQFPKATYKLWWEFFDPVTNVTTVYATNPTNSYRTVSHQFTTPGVKRIRHASITTPGCLSDTIIQMITIPDIPNATITGNTTVCINSVPSVPVTFSGTLGTAEYIFSYNINGGGTLTTPPSTGGTFTINAPTNIAGTFTYNLIGVRNASPSGTPCIRNITGQSIVVNITADATVTLTSAGGTDNQTVCINNPITNITYAVGGSGTGASVIFTPALPGVAGSYAGGVLTISGTPTLNGVFNYTVSTTGPCITPTATGTITVTANATITLTSAAGTDNQTLCINTPLTTITYSVGGTGTGGSVTGLPAGVTGSYAGGIITILGTPTLSGVFNYTVTTTGPCITPTATGTITVTADATLTLTSAGGTDNQTLCINTAITNITYSVGGSGTGATVSGLPAGVTGTYAGGVVTITGTPTAAGVFNYTVTTTGPCVIPTTTGTITVTSNATITLTSAAGTDNQTLCINTPLTTITYSVGGSGTGGSVSGLPAGVTGSYSGGVITILGTPTVSGVFNYTVTTTGPCVIPTATGTITVTADATLTLTSAVGTDNQSRCINTAITNITYAIGGTGTGGSVSGLPPGVTWVLAGGVITISGTPTTTAGSPYIYTVTTTGPCVIPTATGTITVNPDASITLTSAGPTTSQELCRNSTLTNITYAISGGGTGATVTGLPAGVTGVYAGGVFTISGSPTVAGLFNYTVTTTGTCVQNSLSGTILVNQLPTPNFSYTAPSCQTRIISFTDLSVAGSGNINRWAWDFDDPGSAPNNVSNQQNPTHVFSNAGTYNVTLRDTTNLGCTNEFVFSRTVIINNRPVAGFIIPEVCLSDTYAQFIDTSTLANAALDRWDWNFGDPGSGPLNTSTLQNPTHSYSAVGNYSVRLIVWNNALGCRDTITQVLTVNGSFPVANFNVNNPNTLCANDSVAIVEASTVFPGVITKIEIYWDNVNFPAVFQVDNNPFSGKIYRHLYPNFQAPLTKTFTIRYRAYSGGVCVNDKFRNITVNAAPRVQFNNMPNTCLLVPPFQITQASETGGVPGTGVFSGPGVSPTGMFNPQVAGVGTHTILYTYTSSAAGCVDTMSNRITVLDTAHAAFSFVLPACEQTPVSFTDLSTAPASVTLATTVWDFGDGTGIQNYAPGSTFTHIFALPGIYTVTMHNVSSVGCLSTNTSAQVNIDPNHGITLTSANNNQTLCVNNAITPIRYQLSGGATNIVMPPAGLPPGVTASLAGNVITLTGTPTLAGTYNYSIQTTGNTCVVASAAGVITVNPDHAISWIGTSGNENQTLCVNVAIQDIEYQLGGGATNIVMPPAGLPPGVTASLGAGNVITLTGTPTLAGTYNYSIQTTGNNCLVANASGVITVNPDHAISWNATSGNPNQTICVNVAIQDIEFQLSGGATNIVMPPAGLPPGVTASLGAGNVITLTGTPTLAGTYNYTIQTVGNTCQVANASGVITVNADHAIAFTSGDTMQSVCVNTAIDPIVYTFGGGATGVTIAGLPPGVSYTVTGNLLTISGTPTSTTGSPYNFTIQTSGNACLQATATGEIIVNPYPVPNFTFDKGSYCIPNANVAFINNTTPSPLSNYTYDWNFGDGGSSSATAPTHLYTSTGPFTVILKARSTVVLNGGVIGCESIKTNLLDIIHPQPIAEFVKSKPSVCIGDIVTFTDNSTGGGLIQNSFWNMGDGTATQNGNPFTYQYRDTLPSPFIITYYAQDNFGCNTDTITRPFYVYPYPHVNAGPDKSVLEGGSVQLDAIVFANDPQYAWTPSLSLNDSKILRPRVVDPKTDMTYRLTVTARGGCTSSDVVFVKLLKFPVIPNTFTPNNDGRNDEWRINYLNTYPNNRVQVFTRSGNLVFESRGYDKPWDGTFKGKPLPFDTYYYIIEPGNGRDPITGYVTIIK